MKSPQEKNKLASGRDPRSVSSESDTPPAMKRAGRPHRALSRQDAPKGAKALDVDGAETADPKVRAVASKGWEKHSDAALGKPAEKKLTRRARP
jgi:hypothetical protein